MALHFAWINLKFCQNLQKYLINIYGQVSRRFLKEKGHRRKVPGGWPLIKFIFVYQENLKKTAAWTCLESTGKDANVFKMMVTYIRFLFIVLRKDSDAFP